MTHRSPVADAPAVAAGLIGGITVARYSGRRELGGAVTEVASGAAYALADRTDASF